jgi:hypothetical protein
MLFFYGHRYAPAIPPMLNQDQVHRGVHAGSTPTIWRATPAC